MADGFSVQGIEIEGFKGFTSSQEIDFKGRHVFLLGQNGNGKSSIVEAVRWGLFGSANRPNEVIKNQHYPGICRVTVNLMRDGELWKLRRTLNPGAGGTSVAILTDQHGNRRNITDIMPQLDSVNAGEGTHIIFSPQSAQLQKQPENLDPFERTVFNYLGLTHPRALLSNIEEFLDVQTKAEHELGEELTDARKTIDSQLAEVRTHRSYILNAPPWGNGPVPSIAVSEQKVRNFIKEVTGKPPGDELVGLSLDALLESAEKSLSDRRTQGQESLKKEAAELAQHRVCLENVRNIRIQIEILKSSVQNTQSELKAILNGLTSDELRKNLATAKYEATTESIRSKIIQDTVALISRYKSQEFLCPICDTSHVREVLESDLHDASHHSNDNMNSTVVALESQLQNSAELESVLKEQESELYSLNHNKAIAMTRIDDEDKKKLTETDDIDDLIRSYLERESAVKSQIDDQEAWFTSKHAQWNKLKEESRFHQIQGRLNNLDVRRRELGRVMESYDNLVSFGESVRVIREVVETCLSERLAQDIPRVSKTLSTAFRALTQHTYYVMTN